MNAEHEWKPMADPNAYTNKLATKQKTKASKGSDVIM